MVGRGGLHGLLEPFDGSVQQRSHTSPLELGLQSGAEVGQVPRTAWVLGGSGVHGLLEVADGPVQVGARAEPVEAGLQ